MSFWTAVVIIAGIIGLVEMYKARHGVVKDWAGNEKIVTRDDPEARREIEELRERIKVLERIATDGNTLETTETRRIAAEIESLREKQN